MRIVRYRISFDNIRVTSPNTAWVFISINIEVG